MNPKNKMTNMVVIASIAIVVGLAGCSDSSQPPIATPTSTSLASSQAASPTVTL